MICLFQINIVSDRTYRTSKGTVKQASTNETFPAHMTNDYFLDNLTPGTQYTVNVRVDLQDAGIGDPVSINFVTKSESETLSSNIFVRI